MSGTAARTVAQAKINLFLHVLAREAGGHHALETLFQRLDLGDDVLVRAAARGRSLDCRGADVGPVEGNLAWRAAVAYADLAGWPGGFAIELDKRVPVGGGLGGGSADAGAVLRLLDHLAPRPLGPAALVALAATLGADVPFLAGDAVRALAWGRGERMLALPPLPGRDATLVLPGVGVHTGRAFGWLAEDRGAAAPAARLLDLATLGDWERLAELGANDFEGPVGRRVPEVEALVRWRERFGTGGAGRPLVLMTGSGSTWFVLSPAGGALPALDLPDSCTVVRTRTAERLAPIEPVA